MEGLKYKTLVKEESNLYTRRIECAKKARAEKEEIFNKSFVPCQPLNKIELENNSDYINRSSPIKLLASYTKVELEGRLKN